jgi:NAD(P)-dependent dehydrogenase (short-subunit alcohol dehydrogenase family)
VTPATRSLAVVTGAAGGLGARIAARLAADNNDLLLVDRDPAVERESGGKRMGVVADLTAQAGVQAVLATVERHGGGVSVLVNNAGITRDARLDEMEESDFAAVVDVNLVAAMRLTLALEPHLVDGAAVVNMSSRASLGNFGQANYVTSKAALVGMTRALAVQWAPRVRVNAVAPSLVDTPMTAAMPKQVLEKLVSRIPAGRIGAPQDVAGVVALLASPDAAYVTGQALLVCGGRSLVP